MGSQPQPILPGQDDPKYLDLIEKITAKTRANKIRWEMTETGVSANISGKVQLGFVRSRGWASGRGWALFTIRDEKGNEILRVENARLGGFTRPGELRPEVEDNPSLRSAVQRLYSAIEQMGRAEVQKVIELIDKI